MFAVFSSGQGKNGRTTVVRTLGGINAIFKLRAVRCVMMIILSRPSYRVLIGCTFRINEGGKGLRDLKAGLGTNVNFTTALSSTLIERRLGIVMVGDFRRSELLFNGGMVHWALTVVRGRVRNIGRGARVFGCAF